MRGFTQISNEALFDLRLSFGARLAYAAFRHFAWEAGRRKEIDGVRLPALDEIARKVGCSRTTLRTHLSELRAVGLVVTVGRGRGGMTYYVFDLEATDGLELEQRKKRAESDREMRRNLTGSASREDGESQDVGKTTTPHSPHVVDLEAPPPIVKVNGRNLPVDAVAEACGIADASPRITQAVVAVNGRGARPGIRDLFWGECRELAEREGRVPDLAALQADPERFAALLAERVKRKARLIRERQPWRTTLAPAHLRDLWLDVELMDARRDGGLTPEQAARFGAPAA